MSNLLSDNCAIRQHSMEVVHSRTRHSGLGDGQRSQLRQRAEACEPGVGDVGSIQFQIFEREQAAQACQTGVADLDYRRLPSYGASELLGG